MLWTHRILNQTSARRRPEHRSACHTRQRTVLGEARSVCRQPGRESLIRGLRGCLIPTITPDQSLISVAESWDPSPQNVISSSLANHLVKKAGGGLEQVDPLPMGAALLKGPRWEATGWGSAGLLCFSELPEPHTHQIFFLSGRPAGWTHACSGGLVPRDCRGVASEKEASLASGWQQHNPSNGIQEVSASRALPPQPPLPESHFSDP